MTLPPNWRAVYSLYRLRDQVNQRWPNRSKASDGMVADSRHGITSDHYPHYVAALGDRPVVTAIDITHDPAHGVDTHLLANILRMSHDPRIKYLISFRRIASNHQVITPARTYAPWEWRPYDESDPHTSHMHLSVVDGAIADSTASWSITLLKGKAMFTARRTTTDDVWLSNGAGRWGPISPKLLATLTAQGMPYYQVDPEDFDGLTLGCAVQVSEEAVEDAVDNVMSRVGFTVRPRI